MSDYEKGDRVRFLGFGELDPYSRLPVGTEGTVSTVDDLGTVHVDWDDGGRLGMGRRSTARRAAGSDRARPLPMPPALMGPEIQQRRKIGHRRKDLGSLHGQAMRIASCGCIRSTLPAGAPGRLVGKDRP